MYLDKWDLVIIAVVLIYVFSKISTAIENLENRVYDLENPHNSSYLDI